MLAPAFSLARFPERGLLPKTLRRAKVRIDAVNCEARAVS
jgi:hypothetical protein